jgi:hypothetical protein
MAAAKKPVSIVKSRKKGKSRETTPYQPIRHGHPDIPQTKVTFEIPTLVHQRLLEVTRTTGISRAEILTEALYEWLLSNGKADLAALLVGKAA